MKWLYSPVEYDTQYVMNCFNNYFFANKQKGNCEKNKSSFKKKKKVLVFQQRCRAFWLISLHCSDNDFKPVSQLLQTKDANLFYFLVVHKAAATQLSTHHLFILHQEDFQEARDVFREEQMSKCLLAN